ncbi:hypothetical protein AB1Y20_010660 [Prymnesium parvum]|uniref:RNA-binding motif protein 17 n=1 Tax=Prymnesium parvum TaxID=97485 RepID=A0AB34IS58_PRYPA
MSMYALAGLDGAADGKKPPAPAPKPTEPAPKRPAPPPAPSAWASNSAAQRMAPAVLAKKSPAVAKAPKPGGGGGASGGADAEFRTVAVGGGKEPVGATGWYKDIKQHYDPAVPNEFEDWLKEENARKKQRELERALQLKQEKASKALSSLAAAAAAGGGEDESKRRRVEGAEREGEGDPGLSMLQKMGWSEGSGLGKMGQGMKTPLMAKKTDSHTGVIVNAPERPAAKPPPPPPPPAALPPPPAGPAGPVAPTPAGAAAAAPKGAVTFRGRPSRVLLLKNMVGPGEVDAELSGEIGEECSKYGEVLKVTIFEVAAGAPPEEAVRIFVKFSKQAAAMKAYIDLDGRFFGGRNVWVCFFSEQNFDSNNLEPTANEPK